jgi:type III pantothenate kinase
MTLSADIGNTRIKIGLFSGRELSHLYHAEHSERDLILDLAKKHAVKKAIFSSVSLELQPLLEKLKGSLETVLIPNKSTRLPIINIYKSKETLGFDRLASAMGAYT